MSNGSHRFPQLAPPRVAEALIAVRHLGFDIPEPPPSCATTKTTFPLTSVRDSPSQIQSAAGPDLPRQAQRHQTGSRSSGSALPRDPPDLHIDFLHGLEIEY